MREPSEIVETIREIPEALYSTDIPWAYLESAFEDWEKYHGSVDFNPDFQRGHVWTKGQQIHFMENWLRGLVQGPGRVLQFNCPTWQRDKPTGDLPTGVQCIDGLQRLTAARAFMAGEIKPFGFSLEELAQTQYRLKNHLLFRFTVKVHEFTHRKDILQYYLDINSGGTPHSDDELKRVRDLLAGEEVGQKLPKTEVTK